MGKEQPPSKTSRVCSFSRVEGGGIGEEQPPSKTSIHGSFLRVTLLIRVQIRRKLTRRIEPSSCASRDVENERGRVRSLAVRKSDKKKV